MTTPADPSRPSAPTVREIAALTARLRDISARGRDVDAGERAAFLADKDALIARITATDTEITDTEITDTEITDTEVTDTEVTDTEVTGGNAAAALRERYAAQDALSEAVRARAEDPGYVLVGPSARTWLRDPVTGAPAAPVPEHEHLAVRQLLHREELDTTDPEWVTGPDGHANVHSVIYPTPHAIEDTDTDVTGDDDTLHVPEMPEWMRQQARDTEAAIAAGSLPDAYPDDTPALDARIEALRAEHAGQAERDRLSGAGSIDLVEAEFDELCERHPLPGDGPGDWVTTRDGTFWHDYDEVDDDAPISPEIATANPDIWDQDPGAVAVPRSASDRADAPDDGVRAYRGEPEQERREQLARWHAEDQAAAPEHGHTAGHDVSPGDALDRFSGGPTPQADTR